MPANIRAHVSRTTPSRPYDRRSPTTSPTQSRNTHLSRNLPPTLPIPPVDAHTDVPPDHPGLPTYAEYKRIEAGYLHSLSPRKRDKALITQAMFDKIWDVLHQPEACTIETPQFRVWVRKMFTLSRSVQAVAGSVGVWGWGEGGAGTGTQLLADADADAEEAALELERSMMSRSSADEVSYTAVVLHENRPVAIMEQLYELFCYCHVRAGHGGRDKTCAVIREHYSWVPKELTAQFVKACPTCALKRSGQAHGGVSGVGVDAGVLAYRRGAGRGGRKGRAIPLEVEGEMPVQAEPLGLGWLATGGPLDPANPDPCSVREREREREWLRAHGDVGVVSSPIPVSPARSLSREAVLGTRNYSPGGRGTVPSPRAKTLDMSPFHGCNVIHSPGHPLVTSNSNARSDQGKKETRSPSKPETGLPSLASALSNKSLDEDINLTSLRPGNAVECLLPSVLRPLRLFGPVASDTESDSRSSYPFQIDPALLSFNYPGLGLSSEPGLAGDATTPLGLSAANSASEAHGIPNLPVSTPSRSLCRLRAPSSMDIPLLDASSPRGFDSPDSSFEHGVLTAYTTTSGGTTAVDTSLAFSTEFKVQCGSRHSHRDGPFGMLYHLVDEVGQQLEGPLSFSIMTDT